jgi:DNA polymerase III alpha subunit
MGIFRLERLDGALEAVAFPSTFTTYGLYLKDDAPVLVCGTIGRNELPGQQTQQLKLTVQEVYPLGDVPRLFTESVSVHLPEQFADPAHVQQLKDIIRQHPGQTPLHIVVMLGSGEKVYVNAHSAMHVLPSKALIHAVEQLLGEGSLYLAPRAATCLKPPQPRRWERND